MKPQIILGIDPGTQLMGYALLKTENGKTQVLLMDVLKLTTYKDIYKRLEKFIQKLVSWLQYTAPILLLLKHLFW